MNHPFFSRNIGRGGRLVRAGVGLACLIGSVALFRAEGPWWLAAAPAVGGIFALIEAAAGWCVARACGMRTRI
jgi:hypothetical protein